MHLKFLCQHHRDWIYFNSYEAIHNLEQARNQGEMLLQQQKWREALPFLGCGFETCEILWEVEVSKKEYLSTQLTALATLLATCLEHLECPEHARLVYSQTEHLLLSGLDDCESGVIERDEQSCIDRCLKTVRQLMFKRAQFEFNTNLILFSSTTAH